MKLTSLQGKSFSDMNLGWILFNTKKKLDSRKRAKL